MTDHDEIQDMLEGYVDETLDRPTRKLVDTHLAGCEVCRAILDEVAPVDLSAMHTPSVDERSLRRSVRRAMRRTVFDAFLTLLAVWLAVWLVGALIVQPLAISRGGRAAAAAQATIDTATMNNPGAVVTDFTIESTWIRRTFTVEVGRPVGSTLETIGEFATALGPVGFGGDDGGEAFPFLGDGTGNGDLDALSRLGDGTVATVQVWFDQPVSVEAAQAMADSTSTDTRVVWAGFSTVPGWPEQAGDVFGYSTCSESPGWDAGFLSASSASGSLGGMFEQASIEEAHGNVIRSLGNLTDRAEIGDAFDDVARVDFADARVHVASAGDVVTLVVTGPTSAVQTFVSEHEIESGAVLAVDFYNWSTPLCGR